MDHQQRSLRFGALVIVCALLLRLAMTGFFRPVVDFLTKPDIAAFLIYLETGRNVRFSPSSEVLEVFAYESATPDFALKAGALTAAPATPPSFSGSEAASVKFKNNSGKRINGEELITKPLTWDLTAAEPTVLILHTHTTESYTKSKGDAYRETSAFRTLDEAYNMISVGEYLAQLLQAGGITVLHARTVHDYPSYNGSYSNARKTINKYLKEYPSICLVLDLHRDASGDWNDQMRTKATVNGKTSAQLMFVVGTNGSGLKHPDWKDNLALALKLQVQAERNAPGICRNINLRSQRFNQDLSTGALLVEVGAAGNSHQEALTAVEVLAQAIIDLRSGAMVNADQTE
jgi:stage II sporulation protein P